MAKTLIPNKGKDINIKNKRAEFDYLLMDKYTAGIVLTGTEIKSIRKGKASLVDTYCYVIQGEVWVKNMYIAQYEQGSYNNHMERRDRKLLLNRKEIRKMQQTVKSPGFSIVPTLLFIDEKGLAKLDIHIARGKKEYDKRETLKEKEDRRNIDRQFKKNY
ncbi:MAG: SsrA-binding protein SmpB [Bacteroidaceae bacterium]|nr:SsrA-binding protein SmpB [Bacteroidaceae bacterium]MBQ6226341.1 SsrA-binding protein SmpB [Bacteroidaceae bacterium]